MDMAYTFIAGRLTGEPDSKQVGDGNRVTTFRLAVNHGYRGDNGEWIEKEPTYIQVQCWGRLAENTNLTFTKGMPVLVVGRLETSSWVAVDERGHEEKRSIQRINATYAGPDLNERTAQVDYDRVKLLRVKEAHEERERHEAEQSGQMHEDKQQREAVLAGKLESTRAGSRESAPMHTPETTFAGNEEKAAVPF
ncbi:single-stranded DNA-binding protein [Corynebacterium sp. 4HC-13]|uniref:single-stranded DNA-binding protein n=1 Tax=Corynebacterium anserum TaxID=2684406 RepID=UPI001639CD7F|nr:single-stranded DNA-binding protein [Corynebacterium anserum]MBC2681060.1 single-stranded DNA-binding protein [Corynebacterium anserum]